MPSNFGDFYLSDSVLSVGQTELLRFFLEHVARSYRVDLAAAEFKFKRISIGMSPTTKLVAYSNDIYPYFIKIGEIQAIRTEVSNYNRASARIPPLYLPPLETVIDSEIKKYKTENNKGLALVAYRYISGKNKGKSPETLLDAFPRISTYEAIELIDEIFQVIFRDFHKFSKETTLEKFEHFRHDASLFDALGDERISQMVRAYNNSLRGASRPMLPHGMVHGDLHAENLIINNRLNPVVIDFEMMRRQGCLINDFVELEVAILMAAIDSDVDSFGPTSRICYNSNRIFYNFGVDKFSRCVRAIRANLGFLLFCDGPLEPTDKVIRDVEKVYRHLLLRYLCSYAYVARKSMPESRSHNVLGVITQIFKSVCEVMGLPDK